MKLKHSLFKVDWPVAIGAPALTRQSTHWFSCLPFEFVQRHSILPQPFKSLTVFEQALLHYATVMVSI